MIPGFVFLSKVAQQAAVLFYLTLPVFVFLVTILVPEQRRAV